MEARDLLKFDRMITPTIIQIIFYIGLAVAVVGGLAMILMGLLSDFGGGSMVFMGLLYLVLGPIAARIYCEILIVIFKIHENLAAMRASFDAKGAPAPPPVP